MAYRYGIAVALIMAWMVSCRSPTIHTPEAEHQSPITAFTHARIFDGMRFVSRDLCVSGAVIVECPAIPDTTIDLAGTFITPPFGDAHTHHFDGSFTLDWHISLGLESGAFYAMTMTAPTSGVLQIRDRLAGAGNVDVASSLGGLTGPKSHPAEIYEALALGFRTYEQQVEHADIIHASRRMADNAYYLVETEEDVRQKMALLLANNPDHIKVYLRHSERYDEGWGKWGPGGGVDPNLLPLISSLSGENNKRLAIAVSSVEDYRASLNAKADLITHLPCYQDTESDPESPYFDISTKEECLLAPNDALRAAQSGMANTLVVTEWAKDRTPKIERWEKANINALREAGARLLVSVDAYGSTLTEGLIAGVEKGFFTATELMRIATMDTSAFIFPGRKVGCLDIGCEASFIGFAANPTTDISAIRSITYRMKDGELIE